MSNAYRVVHQFEQALASYCGAPFAVTTTSCTMAILLAVAYHRENTEGWASDQIVSMPKHTYVGVPYAVREAGAKPVFRNEQWSGAYRLHPLPIWDSARRFRRGMYDHSLSWCPDGNENAPSMNDEMVCVSFHWGKTLGIQQGGAILHSDPIANEWLRRARFDGRSEGVPPEKDSFQLRRAWHAYMSPEIAAAGLVRLGLIDPNAADIPWDGYPDLSKLEAFR